MEPEVIRTLLIIFQIVILILVAARTLWSIRYGNHTIVLFFFIYGIVCFLISDFYWLVHGLLRPGARIPFSVNEVGEMGLNLLFTSMLNVIFRNRFKKPGIETILSIVFSASAVTLWIGWNGEWIKDIISGIAFGCLIFTTIRAVKASGALSRSERVTLAVASYVLLAMQGLIFIVNENAGKKLDVLCYILMFSVMTWLVFKALKSLISSYKKTSGQDRYKALSICFLSFVWTLNTMYMSSEPMYFVAMIMCSLTMPALMYSVLPFGMKQDTGDDSI